MAVNKANVSKNLLELLQAYPQLKENYNELVVHYWVIFDGVRKLEDIYRATPSETITRCFRDLVMQKKVTPSQKTLERRKERQLEFRHEFASLA